VNLGSKGKVVQFEDFLITAIADLPEIDINTVTDTGVTEVVSGGKNGRMRLSTGTSNDDDKAAISGNLNWTAGEGPLFFEAMFLLSNLTDNMFFVGFGDSLASTNESSFIATSDVVDIETMSDGFGILFDNDATTKNLWCVAAKTDQITVNKVLSSKYNPVAATFIKLGCYVSTDRTSMAFFINDEEVYRVDGTTTLIAAVALCWYVINFEQATACNMDVDYVYCEQGRSNA